jgi:hypothetical protein
VGTGRWVSDDPSGGRRLSRRLAIALPIAAVAGLLIGIPLAVLAGEWRLAPLVCLGAVAVVGTVLAAIEDGRVQRRVDAQRRRAGDPGR